MQGCHHYLVHKLTDDFSNSSKKMEAFQFFPFSPLPLNSLKLNRFASFSSRNNYFQTNIHHSLSKKTLPLISFQKSEQFLSDTSKLPELLLYYAKTGFLPEAFVIWDGILNSSYMPTAKLVSELIYVCGSEGDFDMIDRILRQMELKDSELLPEIYALAVSCFGKRGKLECLEFMIKKMASMGFPVSSEIGNAYVLYYSVHGSLSELEVAYGRLKRSRILIEEEAIRAVSLVYIKENRFYDLGRFVCDVGVGRRNVGNLIWNLLLLSYAARFKMKSLQREFVRMVEAGFKPDLNTFNIRALAFSRMSLIWDLDLSLEHMKHEGVAPDLVTYGCVVDAYLDRRLGRNLEFALSKVNWNDSVSMLTDQLVFEAMGKGDFHSSSEVVLEYAKKSDCTYKRLIDIYLKKKIRSNQVFWNY